MSLQSPEFPFETTMKEDVAPVTTLPLHLLIVKFHPMIETNMINAGTTSGLGGITIRINDQVCFTQPNAVTEDYEELMIVGEDTECPLVTFISHHVPNIRTIATCKLDITVEPISYPMVSISDPPSGAPIVALS